MSRGYYASEKKPTPKNLVQEVESGLEGQRVLIIHSQERQSYEETMRQRCMEKTRVQLEKQWKRKRGFRSLKDVLPMRPIYHRTEPHVRAPIFVAALALLVERALENRLKERASNLSAAEASKSPRTVQAVEFQLRAMEPDSA